MTSAERVFPRRAFLTLLSGAGVVGLLGQNRPKVRTGSARVTLPPAAAPTTVTIDRATVGDFAPLVGQSFRIRLADGRSEVVELVEARALPAPKSGSAGPYVAPFALLFAGPAAVRLPQETYAVEHRALGRFDLFLVPIGTNRPLPCYEAIFG
jgi:hypothetical protein